MAKKTKKELNLEKSLDEYYKVASEARKNCKDYLKWAVKKYGKKETDNNGKIVFRLEFDTEYDDQNISVAYDGGAHPEYASNLYSEVYSVSVCLDDITLDIEDSSQYEFDRVETADLLVICETIQKSVIPSLNEDKDEY